MDGENNGKWMIWGDPYFWKHPNLDMEHLEYSSLSGCIIRYYSCSPRYTLQGTNAYPTTREVRKIMGSKAPFGRGYVIVPRRISHVMSPLNIHLRLMTITSSPLGGWNSCHQAMCYKLTKMFQSEQKHRLSHTKLQQIYWYWFRFEWHGDDDDDAAGNDDDDDDNDEYVFKQIRNPLWCLS